MLSSFFGKILERVAPTLTPTERLLSHLEGGKEDLALELFADPAVAPELNLAARNGGGNTAAHLAAAHGHCRVLKLVLGKRPACLNERSGSQAGTRALPLPRLIIRLISMFMYLFLLLYLPLFSCFFFFSYVNEGA